MAAIYRSAEALVEGRLVGKIGLQITLWLDPDRSQQHTWRGVLRAAVAYTSWAGERLTWWSSTVRDEVSWLSTMAINSEDEDLSSDSAEDLLAALHDHRSTPFSARALESGSSKLESGLLELVLGSSAVGLESWQDVMGWQFYANLPVEGSEVAGFLRVHAPARAEGDPGEAANRLRDFMRACVQVMPVLHGTDGWGLQLPLSYGYFHMNMYAAVALYDCVHASTGLDVYDPAEMAIDFTHGCYTVNWLNYLGDALRGESSLSDTRECSEAIPIGDDGLTVHRLGSGSWVQAGERPLLGAHWANLTDDEATAQRAEFKAYCAAAALLRPWRVALRSNECIAPPPYGYADEASWLALCSQYLRRFD